MKKGGPNGPPFEFLSRFELALGELEAAASLPLPVLLSLYNARVAGEEPTLLQNRAKFGLKAGERDRHAVPERPGLAGKAAAGDRGVNVVFGGAVGRDGRLAHDHLQHGPR